MGKRLIVLIPALLMLLALAACTSGGGNPNPPNPDFTRLTAQAQTNTGEPLSGLSVRVNGQSTGVTTDGAGNFALDRAAFSNGVDRPNQIALGRNGVVVGVRDVVPTDERNLTLRFGDPGTASVSGRVSNAFDGSALSGVELTLFSVNGGVLQTRSNGGAFSFAGVPAGQWQLVGFLKGYEAEMAFLSVADGQSTQVNLSLSPEGQIRPGEGIKVRGKLVDSKSGAPIAGAFISLMADTGYMGVPEPAIWDDVKDMPTDAPNSGGGQTSPGGSGAAPMPMPGSMSSSDGDMAMFAPWRYDPQYQETTTGSDGSFEFPDNVVGYSLYFSYNAEGYLSGTHYESIANRGTDLDLQLSLEPIVPTTISGTVIDEDGAPVEGAYVEFIFSGHNFGGPMPMDDIALPPVMNLGDWAADGTATRGNTGGAPPPPPSNSGQTDGDAGWEEWAESPAMAPGGSGNDSSGGGGGTGGAFDNQMMQRFRWEQQQGRGTSMVADPFNGYFSVVTGADGSFSFEDVPAGPYYVFAGAYRHESYSNNFTAEEDPAANETTIVLPNIPVGSVEGVVTDETGAPIPDVLVNATQPNVDPFTYSDAQGRYRIDNVPVGDWIISGYKSGYLTISRETPITADGVATVNLRLTSYTPPPATLVPFSGRVLDGSVAYTENGTVDPSAGIGGADLVFTPVDNNYGSYAQHVRSSSGGNFGVGLINQFEYNLLIQAPEFQDLFIRIWADSSWPKLDFSIWPISGGIGGGGGWGGIPPMPGGIEPMPWPVDGDDAPPPPER